MTEVSCIIPGSLEEIDTVRIFVRKIKDELTLDAEKSYDLELVLVELFSNIVKHGYQNTDGLVYLTCVKDNKKLVMEVKDNGPEYFPSITQTIMPDVCSDINQISEHGYGIPLVISLMDSIKYERKENENITTVIVEIE